MVIVCGVLLGLLSVVVILAAIVNMTRDNPPSQQGGSASSEQTSSVEAQPTPTVEEPAPINLSADGQYATSAFDLDSGLAVFTMRHQGQRIFAVRLIYYDEQVDGDLANVRGSFEGSKAIQTQAGPHLLQVQADGPWTMTITQPRPSSAPQTTNFSGTGQTATDLFQLSGGLRTFNVAYQGQSTFVVKLIDKDGEQVGGDVVHAFGSFEGPREVRVPEDGIYLFQVQADAPWSIQAT